MKSDVFPNVRNFQHCTRFQKAHFKHQKLVELLPTTRFFECVAMDALSLLKKSARRYVFFLGIAHRLIKLARHIPLWNTIASKLQLRSWKYWVYAYGAS